MATKSSPKAASPLTVKQVCALTGRTEMTVFNWRRGSPRVEPLPHILTHRGARHIVLFPRAKFLAWAKTHGIELDPQVLKELPH